MPGPTPVGPGLLRVRVVRCTSAQTVLEYAPRSPRNLHRGSLSRDAPSSAAFDGQADHLPRQLSRSSDLAASAEEFRTVSSPASRATRVQCLVERSGIAQACCDVWSCGSLDVEYLWKTSQEIRIEPGLPGTRRGLTQKGRGSKPAWKVSGGGVGSH